MIQQNKKFMNFLSSLKTNKVKPFISITAALLLGSFIFVSNANAEPDISKLKAKLQSQIDLMKPELSTKVKGLSTDTKMAMMAILAMHNRYSDKATLRQVMLEVLQDYQGIVMGIMTDSSEMAADSARRLANHRIPIGGLLPYLGLENINDERLSVLETFNDTVEGNSIKLAKAADEGDMAKAASLLAPITSGCVACHGVFRAKPGVSDLLK
jgi:mono/diheme cytochrome c family protein